MTRLLIIGMMVLTLVFCSGGLADQVKKEPPVPAGGAPAEPEAKPARAASAKPNMQVMRAAALARQRVARLWVLLRVARELRAEGKIDAAEVIRTFVRDRIRVVAGHRVNLLDQLEAELAPCLPPEMQLGQSGAQINWTYQPPRGGNDEGPQDRSNVADLLKELTPQMLELIAMNLAFF